MGIRLFDRWQSKFLNQALWIYSVLNWVFRNDAPRACGGGGMIHLINAFAPHRLTPDFRRPRFPSPPVLRIGIIQFYLEHPMTAISSPVFTTVLVPRCLCPAGILL